MDRYTPKTGPSAKTRGENRYEKQSETLGLLENVRREQLRQTERNFRVFRKRDAARTDISQNWAFSKNVRREQLGKTERNFRVFRKRDAAHTDISQNWAVSKNMRREQVQKVCWSIQPKDDIYGYLLGKALTNYSQLYLRVYLIADQKQKKMHLASLETL